MNVFLTIVPLCVLFSFFLLPFAFFFCLGRSLVALGACTFTLVSQFGFVGKADQARVAASVASGVGFIGAGVSKGTYASLAGQRGAGGRDIYVVVFLSTQTSAAHV